MKAFEISVWYRYYAYGELEKNLDHHTIKANNLREALIEASELHKHPFDFIYNQKSYKNEYRANFTEASFE